MLDFMRQRSRSALIKVLFSIIVLVFVFWGVEGFVSDDRLDVVATVGTRQITKTHYQRAYRDLQARVRDSYKDQLTPELLAQMNLAQQALDRLVNATLLEQEARRLGITVSDDEVRKLVAEMPAFQAYGEFAPDQYRRVLRQLRMTPGEFESEQRATLLNRKFEQLIDESIEVSEAELQEVFRFNQEKADLRFVRVASVDLLDQVGSDPHATEQFYRDHRETFRQPERVKFSYLGYLPARFESEVEITPAAIARFYADNKEERFTTLEQRAARHILFTLRENAPNEKVASVQERAEEVLLRARAGEDFAALAAEYSEDPGTASAGGELGSFGRGRMVTAFEDAAFSMTPGEISDLIRTPFGLHIIRLDEVQTKQIRPQSEVEDEIRQELAKERTNVLARKEATADRQLIKDGATLAEVAQAAGLQLDETPLVAIDETLPTLGRQPELIEAAFGLTLNDVSEPVAVDGAWYLVQLQERRASHIPEFQEVAAEAESRYAGEEAELLAAQKAQRLLARLKESHDLDALAAEESLAVEETGPFARHGDYIPKLGNLPGLKKAAFQMKTDGAIIPDTYDWGGNAFVAILKERIPPDMATYDQQRDTLRDHLLARKRRDAMQELLADLRSREQIEYNPSALLSTS